MKILFIFPHIHPYNSQSVREKPSGGTEKVVCFLSEALTKLGHECKIATSLNEFPEVDINWPEVVITQESQLFFQFPKAKKIWWCHHFADQEIISRGAVWARVYADHIVTLSQCQHDEFQNLLRLDSTIIPHGVWLDECYSYNRWEFKEYDGSVTIHEDIWEPVRSKVVNGVNEASRWVSSLEKDPYRLIYASTPFRGLERIPELFKRIKESEPRATIAICSSMATYGKPEEDAKYKDLFDELASIPGVELKGSLNQAQLYAEYSRASIFFYPCIWRETYCLAMDEAIAHGCEPITTYLGALTERVYTQVAVKKNSGLTPVEVKQDLAHHVLRYFKARDNYPDTGLNGHPPKDWLEIAKQWEVEVLG